MVSKTSFFGVALYGNTREIADDFAGIDAPKLKFNFTISFQYTGMMEGSNQGSDDPYTIDFGVRQITRPSPNIIYEDVNYYNFMTKVATKVDFGVVTVTLYDDRNNRAHDIFKNYMEAVSPVTNVSRDQAQILHRYGQSTASSIGPLDEAALNGPIKSIRVTHLTNHLGKKVMYDFINPKIQNVTLDELDMSQSDVNTITFTFIYDTYNVTTEDNRSQTVLGASTVNDLLDEIGITGQRRQNVLGGSLLEDSLGSGIQGTIEQSLGDFEQNSLTDIAGYFINGDNNPLISGLRNLDGLSSIIAGKTLEGVNTFLGDLVDQVTPDLFKSMGINQATDVVMGNLGVFDAVKAGIPKNLPKAIAMQIMSEAIAKAVQAGTEVFGTFSGPVLSLGQEVVTEWANNGP